MFTQKKTFQLSHLRLDKPPNQKKMRSFGVIVFFCLEDQILMNMLLIRFASGIFLC